MKKQIILAASLCLLGVASDCAEIVSANTPGYLILPEERRVVVPAGAIINAAEDVVVMGAGEENTGEVKLLGYTFNVFNDQIEQVMEENEEESHEDKLELLFFLNLTDLITELVPEKQGPVTEKIIVTEDEIILEDEIATDDPEPEPETDE